MGTIIRLCYATLILLVAQSPGLFLFSSQCLARDVIVRDPSGKMIERRTPVRGGGEVIHGPSGELKERKIRRGDTVYVYDKAGRLLRTETAR